MPADQLRLSQSSQAQKRKNRKENAKTLRRELIRKDHDEFSA
jgi:hypothetical protein